MTMETKLSRSKERIEFTLKKKVVVHALALAFSGAAMTVGINPVAMAQSNATGNVFGKVDSPAGATVLIVNEGTGLRRTVTPDASGRYQATALPPGNYKVQLMRSGAVVNTSDVEVIVGQGAEASFAAAATGVQSVQITGARKTIDVSNSNNGATFTAKELAKLPMQQNVDAIIQLAPNTTRADPRYAGGASFGGGGASENAYYINGFPTTNPLTQLGASELPFGGISQAQVLTGGFGAEFGRSVGGVVNITTKSGTNNWEMGVSASIAPKSLRADQLDLYYPRIGMPYTASTDGKIFRKRADNTRQDTTYGAYVGGPIIQDKLFMFVAAESHKIETSGTDTINGTRTNPGSPVNGWEEKNRKIDRYLGKFDWNITDNHRLELTLIGDTPTNDIKLSGYDYPTNKRNGTVVSTSKISNVEDNGAEIQILKYTGNLTEDLTLTALYGQSKSKHTNEFGGFNPTIFQTISTPDDRVPGLVYSNPQAISGQIVAPGSNDTIKSRRLDLEYKLGQHTIRAGLDDNKLSSKNAGQITAGGGTYTYLRTDDPLSPQDAGGQTQNRKDGVIDATATGGGFGTQGYYVDKNLFNNVTNAYSNQTAQYIEDRFQVTKDVLVTLGLRNESFENLNERQVKYLEQKNQVAPRLSAVWDVRGDASLKVFGSAGRYHVQIPTHLAVRGASSSTYTDQYFTYTGVDANGAPTGLTPISGIVSSNNEFGQIKDPKAVAASSLKPTYQDEMTLGFESAFSPSLNVGAKATYRKLKSTIDDFCDARPFDAWALRNNVDTKEWGGFSCASINPGTDNDFLVDFHDANLAIAGQTHTKVHLTAAEIGLPQAVRTYAAVDLFAEHPLRNGWYGKVNYTWSRSYGNTEGQTLSDVGQTDVAATQTWDYPELMRYAEGRLPNDRKHQIKAFGFYDISPQLTVGANVLLASGRPRTCLGTDPDPAVGSPDYTNASHFCFGTTYKQNVPSPRGTVGELPWDKRLDLNAVFKPQQLKGLALKMEIFNIFNEQTIQAVEERFNGSAHSLRKRNSYERVLSTTDPRSMKLTAEYNYKF